MVLTPLAAASKSASPGRMRLYAAGAALLAVLAAGAFYYATKAKRMQATANNLTINITADSCRPNEIVAPAGRATFEIVNASDRTVEWEILDGVMVLEERENIAPGLRALLTTRLAPGTYEMTCGLLNNPRGKLVVTPSAESRAEAARPSLTAFIGPLAERQVSLALESDTFIQAAQDLDEAIKSGDLERARALYAPAQTSYERLEPTAARFGDLDAAINAEAALLEKREDDPAFSGLRRLEYGLYSRNSIAGLGPVADKLVADATALKERLRGLKLAPEDLAGEAARQVSRVADKAASGEVGYAPADLSYFETNLAAATQSVDLLRPLALKAAPDEVARIDAAFAASRASLAALNALSAIPADRADPAWRALARDLRALSAEIARLNAAIGFA